MSFFEVEDAGLVERAKSSATKHNLSAKGAYVLDFSAWGMANPPLF